MIKVVEGSYAVAHAVMCCSPDVVSAYPITPQTHIVENLSQLVANGDLNAEFMTVDSEFSAMSALVGACAMGARCYSSTTSQGLALMYEVLYNVLRPQNAARHDGCQQGACAPLNIWNDQQDSIGARDVGWIQIYAENVQEAVDMTPQAYNLAEDQDIYTPIMVCMDGFVLTHVYEPVDLLDKDMVKKFLPDFKPKVVLDPKNPVTIGAFADPSTYTEFRYLQFEAMQRSLKKIEDVANEFKQAFGRYYGGLIDTYQADDAEVLIVTLGSVVGTVKDAIDEMRAEGIKAAWSRSGATGRSHRGPEKRTQGLRRHRRAGKRRRNRTEAGLVSDLKAAFYNSNIRTPIVGFTAGLGGRDITIGDIKKIVEKAKSAKGGIESQFEFLGLRKEII
jgi:pyruvate ferredoxin oxidoreductase alpha subunit